MERNGNVIDFNISRVTIFVHGSCFAIFRFFLSIFSVGYVSCYNLIVITFQISGIV